VPTRVVELHEEAAGEYGAAVDWYLTLNTFKFVILSEAKDLLLAED
jgi:hypothetical protein